MFVLIGPIVVWLLVERVPSAMGGGDGVEVGLTGVAGFVELVYHIIIKLFSNQ